MSIGRSGERAVVVCAGVTLALFGLTASAGAEVASWTAPLGGDWFTPANWSTGAPPSLAGIASFTLAAPNNYDVTLNSSATLAAMKASFDKPRLVLGPAVQLQLAGSSGLLVGGATTTNNTTFTISGGTVLAPRVDIGSAVGTFTTVTFEDATTVNVSGNFSLGLSGSGGSVSVTEGSKLTIGGDLKLPGGGANYTLLEATGAGSAIMLTTNLQTGTNDPHINVSDGALLSVPGFAKIASFTGVPGVVVSGTDSRFTVGGTLDVGYNVGGTGWYGYVGAFDHSTVEVGGMIRVQSQTAPSATLAASGGATIKGSEVAIAANVFNWGGLVDIDDGHLILTGSLVGSQPLNAARLVMSGPIDASGLWILSGSSSGSQTILEVSGTTHASNVTLGSSSTIRGRGGLLDCNVTTGGLVHVRVLDTGFDTLAVGGDCTLGTSGSMWVQWDTDFENLDYLNAPPLLDVAGTLTLNGPLTVSIDSTDSFWDKVRPPIVLAQAQAIEGSFSGASIDSYPGAALELRVTPTQIILQRQLSADFDNDGDVDATDLATLLGAWRGRAEHDLNGDGIVECADLAILLSQWTGAW
ncbi:MAG: hypothetical protein U0572_17565 [Phycisphaerales bacterium]